MNFLLDVNALIALGFADHEFHARMVAWVRSQRFPRLFTCSISEIGFVRILAQAHPDQFNTEDAKKLLFRIKKAPELTLEFLSDDNDISVLPVWAKTPGKVTDGHLEQLARSHGAVLATFDAGIPSACRIP